MTRLTLGKSHKLCSHTAIDRLFEKDRSQSAIAYPLRAVWCNGSSRRSGNDVQFLIIVPKKRLRHAVDRVKMRRRVREAYRLIRHDHLPATTATGNTDIAFIYVADKTAPYQSVARSMHRLLSKIFPSVETPDEPKQQ